jgi:hypothetical protein
MGAVAEIFLEAIQQAVAIREQAAAVGLEATAEI